MGFLRRYTATLASPPYAWLVVVLLATLMLINFADKVVFGLAAKPIIAEYHMSLSTYGLINSAFFLAFLIGSIIGGFAGNRLRTTWLIMGVALVWALAQFGMVAAFGVATVMFARVILGFAEGPAFPLVNLGSLKWLHESDRTVGVAILNVGSALGVLIAAPVLGYMIGHHGWRSAFFTTAVVGLVWCIIWLLFGKESPVGGLEAASGDAVAESGDAAHIPYWRIFSSGTFIAATIGAFAGYWWIAITLSFGPLYLQDVFGLTLGQTSIVMAAGQLVIIFITFIALGFLIKWLLARGVSRRYANGGVAAATLLLSGAAALFVVEAPTIGVQIGMWLVTALAVEMFTIGAALCAQIAPPSQRGGVLGLWVALYSLAGVIAPAVAGHLTTGPNAEVSGLQDTWLITGTLLMIAGIVAAVFIRPDRDARRLQANAVPSADPVQVREA